MLHTKRAVAALLAVGVFSWSPAVMAQIRLDDDDDEDVEEAAEGDAIEKALDDEMGERDKSIREPGMEAREELPEIGEDKLQEFKLERGFYFSGDLGLFQTFGGTEGVSNLQPFMAVRVGIDIGDYFGVQLVVSQAYSSGNPVSDLDLPGAGGNETVNYGMLNMGLELVGALRPSPRFALEPKVGGGFTRINPPITDPGDVNSSFTSAPNVTFGLDLKYLTLLTDFTAGLSFTGYYILGPNVFGLSEAFVVRYTF